MDCGRPESVASGRKREKDDQMTAARREDRRVGGFVGVVCSSAQNVFQLSRLAGRVVQLAVTVQGADESRRSRSGGGLAIGQRGRTRARSCLESDAQFKI